MRRCHLGGFGVTWEVSIILSIALGCLFYFSKSVSLSGSIAGALLTFVYGLAPNPFPFLAFAAFVVIGTLSSRIGRQKKIALGVYQNEKGPRNWTHALANCGVGGSLICCGRFFPDILHPNFASILAVASLAAVCADTCASEWGTWLGGQPRNILNLRPVAIGSDGAVTWPGTWAGIVGAVLIASVVLPFVCDANTIFLCLVASGIVGNVADSLLGATIEPHLGHHGGSIVNTGCSLVGAATMAAIYCTL